MQFWIPVPVRYSIAAGLYKRLKLALRQNSQVLLPVASPQQTKLRYSTTDWYSYKKTTGHWPYHNMCYKSSRISGVIKAKCWTWLHFILWGWKKRVGIIVTKGKNGWEPPPKAPSPHQQRRGNNPISLSCLVFQCLRQLSRKFTASFF